MTTDEQVLFTQAWWRRCLADPAKLDVWLQKLQRTELGGFTDHIEFINKHPELTPRERTILKNVADDELKHSGLLIDLMRERRIPVTVAGGDSGYWGAMLADANTFSAYCAANHYGEALAAFRFEVIQAMPETPADIRYFLDRALPDEQFHRETLRRLASEDDLIRYGQLHAEAAARLRRAA